MSRTSTLSPRPPTSEEHHAEAGESEAEIQRALFVGNYEAAVNTCLQVRPARPARHAARRAAAGSMRLYMTIPPASLLRS